MARLQTGHSAGGRPRASKTSFFVKRPFINKTITAKQTAVSIPAPHYADFCTGQGLVKEIGRR
ncbi:MAG: hypothetical protein GY943_21980 [Chloroflexi bacterium]|nr:hypothetical protein [Chloroflexota bacterium]